MTYRIGGHIIVLHAPETLLRQLLPSFTPFIVDSNDNSHEAEATMQMYIHTAHVTNGEADNGNTPTTESATEVVTRQFVRDVDTGNGITRVERYSDGGYRFLIHSADGQECALLTSSADFTQCHCTLLARTEIWQSFALNNTMMLSYAFSTAAQETLLLHASVVRYQGKAYAFTAPSGTGKSTQVANWLRAIDGCDLINDDNPIIRMMPDGKPMLYGSPWSGKTPCYRNVEAPLGAVIKIERADSDYTTPLSPLQAFSTLITACSSMKWDEDIHDKTCQTISAIVGSTKMMTLHCTPHTSSAIVCKNALYT